jgi:hypothetical protein
LNLRDTTARCKFHVVEEAIRVSCRHIEGVRPDCIHDIAEQLPGTQNLNVRCMLFRDSLPDWYDDGCSSLVHLGNYSLRDIYLQHR